MQSWLHPYKCRFSLKHCQLAEMQAHTQTYGSTGIILFLDSVGTSCGSLACMGIYCSIHITYPLNLCFILCCEDFSRKTNTLLPAETTANAYLPFAKTLALEQDYSNLLLTLTFLSQKKKHHWILCSRLLFEVCLHCFCWQIIIKKTVNANCQSDDLQLHCLNIGLHVVKLKTKL